MSNFQGFAQKKQELVYLKMTEKMLQYVSYKLVSVLKMAEESGLSVRTGELYYSAPGAPRASGEIRRGSALSSCGGLSKENNSSVGRSPSGGPATGNQPVSQPLGSEDEHGSTTAVRKRIHQDVTDAEAYNKYVQQKEEQHLQWLQTIKKIFKAMAKMEAQKPAEPKFSMAVFPLMRFLKRRYDFKTGRPTPSNFRGSNLANDGPARENSRTVAHEKHDANSDYYDHSEQRRQHS